MTTPPNGREVPTPPAATQPSPRIGWYRVPGRADEIRWRDAQHWTAYRIVKGEPGASWFAVEPPLIGYVFGAVFLALAPAQFGLAALAGDFPVSGLLMLLLAGFWLAGAISASVVRGLPLPQDGPLAFAAVEPLPGREEGPGAGWYPVGGSTSRWWSGARWGSYIAVSGRVRPTFTGPKTYRALLVTGAVIVAIGAAALLAGAIVLLLLPGGLSVWIGGFLIAAGVLLGVLGGIVFPIARMRRPALLLPEHPPAPAGHAA